MKPLRFKLVLASLFHIWIANHVLAQPITFLKSYNAGNSGYAVREVNGSDLVIAGSTDFYYNFRWFTMSSIASTNGQKFTIKEKLYLDTVFVLPSMVDTLFADF